MPKDDNPVSTSPLVDNKAYQAAIDDKVREMLEPEIKDPEPEVEPAPEESEAVEETPEPEVAKSPEPKSETKLSRWKRFQAGWKAWWHDPVKRRLSIAGIVIALVLIFTVPMSRYFVLNTVGVRSAASMVILDDSTQQPLKSVQVNLGGQTGQTDDEGRVTFSKLRLGKQTIVIQKRAFAEFKKDVTLGWGSNKLGDIHIQPTGTQYAFEVIDYLSEKPLEKVQAISGDFNAQADEKGLIKLTIEDTKDSKTVEVTVSLEGYREEKITLDLDNQSTTELAMVPAHKHYFVSKRSGKYDIYKIDADGKNETKILSGSGAERDDLVLVPQPTNGYVALVSTRENVHNSAGFLLSTLTLIEPEQNTPTKLAQSERIQIVDWMKDKLVYVQITEGASAANPKRHRLMSYDTQTGKTIELAAANYFNDVISVNGSIFYAPSATYSSEAAGFYKISPDGTRKQTVHNEEVWNVFRTEYDKLVISSGSSWYDFLISSNKLTKLSGEPPNIVSRVYIESPDGAQALWTDQRDGKGVLLGLTIASKEEKNLYQASGLQNPVHWLNDRSVVFRVSTSQETADYVMSLDGGQPRKLKDVTKSAGIDRWYYY